MLFLYAFLHLHNLVGLGIWWCWRRERKLWEAIPLLLCLLGSVLLLSTPVLLNTVVEWHPPELDAAYFQHNLAGFAPESWQLQLVMLFSFLQSVHYVVWIRLIPEEARKQETPRTFYRTFIALKQDFGRPLLLGCFAAMAVLALWAVVEPRAARFSYLHLISFHGFLELAVCAYASQRSSS